MTRLTKYRAQVQQYGVRRCLFRAGYDLNRKIGLQKRRFPAWQWDDRPLGHWLKPGVPFDALDYMAYREKTTAQFFFPFGQPPRPEREWGVGAARQAKALGAGRFRYFSQQEGELGYPAPDWFLNPFTGQRDSTDKHWCDRSDFDPRRGDIKYIWEPSRFCWAYALVRAYAAQRDDKYAETFWLLAESWMAANPPQMGPHWMCGQEIAIRVMACTFALAAFWNSPSTTASRVAQLVVLLAGSAERIAGNINAARNQMGNHAVSEAAGLWTVGVLFPELAGAERWRKLGRYVLEDEVRQYNSPDGSYTQHSMNYQRLMLQNYAWSLRIAQLNGCSFSMLTQERLVRSYEFLYQLQDEGSGRLPNYGPNDGALVIPLTDCDYADYRPVIGTMHYLMKQQRLYLDGPWSEELLWFFGSGASRSPIQRLRKTSRQFRHGGYYTFRGKDSWAMVRCHSYHNRPNQADMLHLDLWFKGLNLLRDTGTFSYYDPAGQWNAYFPSTPAHNTITVGGADQMVKGARFRWYSLVQSRHVVHREHELMEYWQGEHYGYRRLPCRAVHRRAICRIGESHWLIIDDVLGTGTETVALRWHMPDVKHELQNKSLFFDTPSGPCQLHILSTAERWQVHAARAVDNDSARTGWESLHYGQREPIVTVCAQTMSPLPVRFVTLLALGEPCTVESADPGREVRWRGTTDSVSVVRLTTPGSRDNMAISFERDGRKCELGF